MSEKTKVVFRVWTGDNKGVLALFPEEAADTDAGHCLSYENTGQHGSADALLCVLNTRPALPHEYADLKKELERRGYDLEIRRRISRKAIEIRRQQLVSLYG